MVEYEYIWRNKFISTDAKSFDDIINSIEKALEHLKKMKETGKIKYIEGAEDDYARFITTDKDIAEKFDFDELDYEEEDFVNEDEGEFEGEEFEDEVLDFSDDDEENKDEFDDEDEDKEDEKNKK